ncbi:MAG TPA: Trk system potassium transporter TrkA [Verrucomicrobia bacterium]|nr:Trk system potassium transporter TrkA [Verrucomicrobiota bacterium]
MKSGAFAYMRILIIGAGNTGRNLAIKFCEERHDVVVVDVKAEPLQELEAQLDVLTIQGEGANPRLLEDAGISKSDMLVAVTDSDEVNILACVFARAAGVEHKVARVSNADYIHHTQFDLKALGVDLIINQKEECAQDLFNILRMPGAVETADMLDGKVLAVGLKVHMDSPLLMGSLKGFPDSRWLSVIRFIAVIRGKEIIVPRGDTQFMIGDDIYFVGRPEDITPFINWAWPERSIFQKVIVAGGGNLGIHLAALLEKTESQIILIESDEDRANYCSGILNKTMVIRGNALDQETIENVGIVNTTAYVAVTGNDENNIIGCLVAGKLGASFTAAQVNKPEYVPIINNLSLLDRAVNPHLSMMSAILHFVRGKNVKAAAVLRELPGELLEVVIPEKGKWTGKAIKDITFPDGVVIATVLRDKVVCAATGDLEFTAGDRVVIYCAPKAAGKLDSLFKK